MVQNFLNWLDSVTVSTVGVNSNDTKRELEKNLNFYLQKRFVSCIIVFVVDEDDKFIGISPSGKALDSDSSIRGFESLYPSS